MISKEEAKINKAIEYLEEIEDVSPIDVYQWEPNCRVDLEATLYSVRELARKAINILEDRGLIKDEF